MKYMTRGAQSLTQFDDQCRSMGEDGFTLHSWRIIETRHGPTYISVWQK